MATPLLPLSGANLNRLTTRNQDMHGQRVINAGDAQSAQDYVTLKQLNQVLSTLSIGTDNGSSGTNITVTGSGANVSIQILTANTTITTALTATAGSLLILLLTQDSSGGRTITFDVMFTHYSSQIDTSANTLTSFLFVGNGTKWIQVGLMGTGM